MFNYLKNITKSITLKLVPKFIVQENIDYELLENKLIELKIKKNIEVVTIGIGSKFYEQTQIHNAQNNKHHIVIGQNTHVRAELLIFAHKGKIEIGDNTYIGQNTFIWSADDIKIGNGVFISHNCNIVDTNSHEINYIERIESYKKKLLYGEPTKQPNVHSLPIVIEDYAWINFNVIILKGVTIGKGAIVAAGAVVTKNVAAFTMVAGNPAKFIKNIPQ